MSDSARTNPSHPTRFLQCLAALLVIFAAPLFAAEPAATKSALPAGKTQSMDTDAPSHDHQSVSAGKVLRAQFTRAIRDREPVDDVAILTNDNDEIFFFSELKNYSGHTVTHRWEYRNEVIAEVKFQVKGPRWRVHSSKKINPQQTGVWSVVILADGNPVQINSFEVVDKTP
jgi:hypothetical protein